MRDDDDAKTQKGTDTALALATVLLNVLIILALCGGARVLHSLIARPDSSGAFLRGYTTYR
ncbi:MAG TPA: hypothetical protein VGA87_04200 [Pyrinomonadaceae bacterium]|jgi:hypothetical protein